MLEQLLFAKNWRFCCFYAPLYWLKEHLFMKKIKIFFLRHVVQEKICPCFNPLVLTMGLYSALSTTEEIYQVLDSDGKK